MFVKRRIIQFVFIGFCFLGLSACKKHVFDYRNKFLGNYHFTISQSWWDLNSGHHDTTFSDEGKIWYGSNSDAILVSFSSGKSSELTIYEDGTLRADGCSGEFQSTTKVSYGCIIPSPAHSAGYSVTGEKK